MKKSKVRFGDNGSFLVVTCHFGKRMDLFGLFFRGHVFVKDRSG